MDVAKQTCWICRIELPLHAFHKDKSRKSGHSNRCKKCQREKSAFYREKADWKTYLKTRLADDAKRQAHYANQKAWLERNPHARPAYTAVHKALRHGVLVRPNECSKCGLPCTPEAHHEDYTKPLEVVWLCKSCHESIHHVSED